MIRPATDDDWSAVWAVLGPIVAAGDTFSYDPGLTEPEAKVMWMTPAPGRTVVAVDDAGAVVGTANMYANRPGPGAHIASGNVMVDARKRGMGIGRLLLTEMVDWATTEGFRGIQFNAVAASNVHAVGLYESIGFTVIGTVPGAFRHPALGDVGLHVMFKPL